jgi:anti-anti-sigma factor
VDLQQDTTRGVTVLDVIGRIDSITAPTLQDRIAGVLGEPHAKLLVDFTQLDYISSAGFRILLLAAKRADEAGCRFVLCGVLGKVRELFELAGFLDLFSIQATREEGLAAAAG